MAITMDCQDRSMDMMRMTGNVLVALLLCHLRCAKPSKLDLKPTIPTLIDDNVPAMIAFWEVKTMIGQPGKLPNTIDSRAVIKEHPYRHFYSKLKEIRDDEELKTLWSCAEKVKLSMQDAKKVAALIVPDKEQDRMAKQLVDLSHDYQPAIAVIRSFESIKRLNANYQPALIKLANLMMASIGDACPKMQEVMQDLQKPLFLKPKDIKEDNAGLDDLQAGQGVDRAALIAMTVIGLVSIVVNIVQGVFAARLSFDQQRQRQQQNWNSPLMTVSAQK